MADFDCKCSQANPIPLTDPDSISCTSDVPLPVGTTVHPLLESSDALSRNFRAAYAEALATERQHDASIASEYQGNMGRWSQLPSALPPPSEQWRYLDEYDKSGRADLDDHLWEKGESRVAPTLAPSTPHTDDWSLHFTPESDEARQLPGAKIQQDNASSMGRYGASQIPDAAAEAAPDLSKSDRASNGREHAVKSGLDKGPTDD